MVPQAHRRPAAAGRWWAVGLSFPLVAVAVLALLALSPSWSWAAGAGLAVAIFAATVGWAWLLEPAAA